MAKRKGRLIVMEGSDGSGKATQSRLLMTRLRRAGIPAAQIAFPGYARSFFGGMVAQYLRGEFGPAGRVDPRMAAVLYAADRWEACERITRWLDEGRIVVCDRYVDSNKAHQAARLVRDAEREAFLGWIDRLEFKVLGLPRPDFTLFLHVPVEVADVLIGRKAKRAYLRGSARDIHEADQSHLQRAEAVYLQLARARNPRQGALIECVHDRRLLTRVEVSDLIWAVLERRGMLRR